jgi:hypothetical protein
MRLDDVKLTSSWGGPLALDHARVAVDVEVPFAVAPPWFRGVVYASAAGALALVLLFLHHLRQLFLHVRRGEPFDRRNAARVRWLGVLLLAGELLSAALGFWQSTVVLRTVGENRLALSPSFAPDGAVILIAVVLIALAEVFRRGAALEDEQSLVV